MVAQSTGCFKINASDLNKEKNTKNTKPYRHVYLSEKLQQMLKLPSISTFKGFTTSNKICKHMFQGCGCDLMNFLFNPMLQLWNCGDNVHKNLIFKESPQKIVQQEQFVALGGA